MRCEIRFPESLVPKLWATHRPLWPHFSICKMAKKMTAPACLLHRLVWSSDEIKQNNAYYSSLNVGHRNEFKTTCLPSCTLDSIFGNLAINWAFGEGPFKVMVLWCLATPEKWLSTQPVGSVHLSMHPPTIGIVFASLMLVNKNINLSCVTNK